MTKTTSTNSATTRPEIIPEAVSGVSAQAVTRSAAGGHVAKADGSPAAKRSDDDGMRLAALRDLAPGTTLTFTDVRGFPVQTAGGKPVGSVRRILVDQADASAPRYLDIQLDAAAIGSSEKESPNVLIPIGRAQVRADPNVVILPEINVEKLRTLPRLAEGAVEWQHEMALGMALGIKTTLPDRSALYRDDLFSVRYFQQLQPK